MHGVLPALNSLADRSFALARFGFSRRTSAHDLYPAFGSNANTIVILLATIVLVGQALLVLLLVTLLVSQRIGRRNPTLLNVILVSIFAGFPGLILVYSGNVFVKDVPPMLCLTQATLKNGVDTMFVMAPLALVIELYWSTKTSSQRFIAFRRIILVALPYITFFGFALWTTIIGIKYPKEVSHDKNDVYCEVHSAGVGFGLSIFGAIVVAITIAIQVLTALALRRIWRTAERSKESTAVSISILYRLAGYTVVQVMYLVIASLTILESDRVVLIHDFYEASMPLLVFLVYGLSPDIIRVWFCMAPRHQGINARQISNPTNRPWTMVGFQRDSVHSSSSVKPLTPSDTEKGLGLVDEKGASSQGGSDAGSHYSWDPRWERASRWILPNTSPVMRAPEPAARLPREPRTPQNGMVWGQAF